jgi:hypothetical protein
MTCNCKNEDGTKALKCSGLCSNETIVAIKEQKSRPELDVKIILEKIDFALSRFVVLMDKKFSEVNKKWTIEQKEAYLNGIKDGLKIARETGNEY